MTALHPQGKIELSFVEGQNLLPGSMRDDTEISNGIAQKDLWYLRLENITSRPFQVYNNPHIQDPESLADMDALRKWTPGIPSVMEVFFRGHQFGRKLGGFFDEFYNKVAAHSEGPYPSSSTEEILM